MHEIKISERRMSGDKTKQTIISAGQDEIVCVTGTRYASWADAANAPFRKVKNAKDTKTYFLPGKGVGLKVDFDDIERGDTIFICGVKTREEKQKVNQYFWRHGKRLGQRFDCTHAWKQDVVSVRRVL